jgi:hypothetical protein
VPPYAAFMTCPGFCRVSSVSPRPTLSSIIGPQHSGRPSLAESERRHVGLLGDLEVVGRCLAAIVKGRRGGCGLGSRGDGEEIRDRGDEEYSFCGGLAD